jgi:capsular exopolysaccharide synthesis family protein
MDFLNGLIANYQEYNLEKKNATATRTIEFITEQINGITDSLRTAERQLEKFKNENVLTDLSGEALRLYQKAEEVEKEKMELAIRQNYYKYLLDYIKTNPTMDQVILPSSVGLNDEILSDLISKMVDLQLDMKLMLSQDKLENPIVNERKKRISELKENILESVRNQQSVDKIKQGYLEQELKTLEKSLDRLPGAERKLVSITRNYTLLENLYIFLLQKRAEAGISRASTVSDIEVVNPPRAGVFISPQPVRNYLIAAFAGISVPVLIFVLLEFFNTRVQSREDIEKLTKIPFIGGVGHKRDSDNQVVLKAPKSAIAESFRALRSNLNYFIGNRDQAVFLITSSISGEGKTFSSINLASVFALSGRRTLIIGADMRRPKIFADFGLSNQAGLSNYLAGLSGFSEVVQKTVHENLDLVSGGPVPPNPSELLLTKGMDDFILEAKKHYSYIIIDTPPLGIVTDAFILTKYADHTLFIVRQDYTPKILLRNAEEFYSSGKLKNISLFLNDVFRSGPGYGYSYGGYGYAYGYDYYGGKRSSNGYYEE